MKPFIWEKQGVLFDSSDADFSYGSHPTITHIKDDEFLVIFTRRNSQNKSYIFTVKAIISDARIQLVGEPRLALSPGAPGFFDCDGVISAAIVSNQGHTYLYYIGWQNLPDNMWICDTGRAVVNIDKETIKKEFLGPILGRDKENPLFAAATAFYVTSDGKWHSWYNSGVEWQKKNKGWHHRYGLFHAESADGIDWKCDKSRMAIPFKNEEEYAFGRPTVVKHHERYHMWYAHRATPQSEAYRIGYSWSMDGYHWQRQDERAGIDVSSSGWDSEMICYPYVFQHKSDWYMLYNGNAYGKTGFGYAVLRSGFE